MYIGETTNRWRAFGIALQGGLIMLCLLILSLQSFGTVPFLVDLTLLPLIGLFFWPSRADEGSSSILIFLIGIIKDVLTGGPIGFWSFIYLSCYGLLHSGYYGRRETWREQWFRFCGWMIFVLILIWAIVFFAYKGPILLFELALQSAVTGLLFPVIYFILRILPLSEFNLRKNYVV